MDKAGEYRVTSNCYAVEEMVKKKWFVLPPVQAWYYQSKSPDYKEMPGFAPGCVEERSNNIGIIYPEARAQIFIPRLLDGSRSSTIFEAAHSNSDAVLHWHINKKYYGSTRDIHKIDVQLEEGKYMLVVLDEIGEEYRREFNVVER